MGVKRTIILCAVGGLVAGLVGGLALGSLHRPKMQTVTTTVTDTVTVHDTVRITQPKEVSRTLVNTVYLPVHDTLRLHDTLYLAAEREAVRYSDATYTAFVSGVQPRLDSIHVYRQTRYVTTMVETVKVQRPKHWGVGVSAGYGISTQGLVPYIGIGISYNVITF